MAISYVTSGTDYENEVQHLKGDLERFKIPYEIMKAESQGNWTLNCYYRAVVIQKAMLKYPNKNIVWIDADARIRKYPKLFDDMKAQIAATYRGDELLWGTVFYKNCDLVFEFCDDWWKDRGLSQRRTVQSLLDKYIKERGLSFYKLPTTYTQIFDLMVGDPSVSTIQEKGQIND